MQPQGLNTITMKHNKQGSRRRVQKSSLSRKDLIKTLSKFFAENKRKYYNARSIISKLDLKNSKDSVQNALEYMCQDKWIVAGSDNKFTWNNNNSMDRSHKVHPKKSFTGKVDMTRTGAGYIVSDDYDEDIFVHPKNLKGAMNNDIVRVEMSMIPGKRKPEGKITEIVTRALSQVLGTIRNSGNVWTVYPASTEDIHEIEIKEKNLNGAKEGNHVLLEITKWGKNQHKTFYGKILEVLKNQSENDIAMQSILLDNGFELHFPQEVMDEAAAISREITTNEVARRRDMRGTTTFTIDPETAKDFDDALSFKQLENGNYEVGVHIADVAHYIEEGSALDKEALNRSTSVYLVDRVLPMLPEELSNDLCSLNPNEDKYTFSAIFEMKKNGKIKSEWFGRTVIHSNRRFTYEEAQERLESKKGDFQEELNILNKIHHNLREHRYKNGSISFESEEVRFILDDNGKPIDTYVKERKDAHMLVEDFMLLANRSVGKYISEKDKIEIPFVYRIHDEPNPDKLVDFAVFAKALGYKMHIDTPTQIAESFNALAAAAKENEQLKMLEPLAIRTMSKAEYSSENIGHYGLGFQYYSHFTSPIRRYSDVLTHRILFKNLEHKTERVDKDALEQMCKHISIQERNATQAERESIKYKQVEYMEDQIGNTFNGRISGMIEKGIFVELLDSKAEGLIKFSSLTENYDVADSRLVATGRRTGDEIKMGDRVQVKVLGTNIDNRLIDFELLEMNN
tara:strand:- start:102 stop:2318 length:2217 start_codon:yes stop_codon:yes gene_type:complete